MTNLLTRNAASAILLLLIATSAIAQPVNSEPPSGITDPGFADFRQLVDVNNDKLPDYCRFVGTAPAIFLSCQLGSKQGTFAQSPYAFSAPVGTDLGAGPRLIMPIGGVRPAFCRYIPALKFTGSMHASPEEAAKIENAPIGSANVASATASNFRAGEGQIAKDDGSVAAERPVHIPVAVLPALDVTQALSCIQAGQDGFDASKEINPNLHRYGNSKVALLTGSDGSTIELVYGQSNWIASVQDHSGRHLHLSGFTQKSTGAGYVTYLKLYSDEDDAGKPFTAKYLKKYPRANIILDQFFQLASAGYTSYSTTGNARLNSNIAPGPGTGYTVTRSGNLPGSLVFVYDGCSPADLKSPATPYLGTLASNATIEWKGPQPPSLVDCTPPTTARLDYFREVFQFLGSKVKELSKTGNPSVDNKSLEELNSADIQQIINTLENEIAQSTDPKFKVVALDAVTFYRWVQTQVNTIGLGALGSTFSAWMLANPGSTVPYLTVAAATTGFVLLVNGVVEVSIAAMDVGEAKACMSNYQKSGEFTPECRKLFKL